MEKVHEAAKALLELAWWVQRKGPIRAGFEPLPATERVILGYLEGNERSSVTEVGAALDIKPSNVSAAVRELSARGLVERVADPDDKRKSLLSLTDEARRNKSSIDAAVTGSLEEVLEQLSPEHRESLFASLDALGDVVLRLRTADR
ncbi:MarR family transcriptional regulator [Pseudarthrobacter sp. H3Y2-7]|jgi:DNA-binding MarR family transcriptional regulator|uniref:MarR family winged helix-turn-helix transcriptional regulator n=1 Tax=Pseudarthrobacter TaxID=1742993 RepID=UPI0023B1A62A|nr:MULTISPECIES: MarR family transcriptional regulator [unclassified Pseudarthrobacter]MDE8669800.1 MarR family transcriptional regulator [Pseudarthrobacter sp. H3Y2-7]